MFDGDATMVAFLQRLIGYALSGSTREQCFAVLYGTGANGKSVLLNVLEHVLGDMVGVAAFSAFELKGAGASTADLASLRGRRIVIAQEGERSRPMAEAVLKRVTGGDRITCRHLYRDEMTYRPNFLLLLASNYRPRFGGQDDGLWRRVKLIPFNRYFTPDGRDPYLTETLITEADGILAWAIEGAVEWYESGLGDPPAIIAATQDYKETSDELAGFVGWEVVSDRRGEIKGSALYEAYRVWADHEGVKPWTKRALYEAVAERMPGIRKVKRQDGVWMQGLRLAAAADRNDEHDVTDGLNNSFGFPDSSLFEGVSERGSEPSCASSSVDEAAQ